jgi:class 3 adenylate cyclase
VVLFADISGFTNLGKELRATLPPLEAAAKLAKRIGTVLKELTAICVEEFEGDVVKFAGMWSHATV